MPQNLVCVDWPVVVVVNGMLEERIIFLALVIGEFISAVFIVLVVKWLFPEIDSLTWSVSSNLLVGLMRNLSEIRVLDAPCLWISAAYALFQDVYSSIVLCMFVHHSGRITCSPFAASVIGEINLFNVLVGNISPMHAKVSTLLQDFQLARHVPQVADLFLQAIQLICIGHSSSLNISVLALNQLI